MATAGKDDVFSALNAALSEQAARAAAGHKEISEAAAKIRAAFETFVEKVTVERVDTIALGEESLARLASVREAIADRSHAIEETHQRSVQLERQYSERAEEIESARQETARLQQQLGEQAPALDAAHARVAQLEAELKRDEDLRTRVEQLDAALRGKADEVEALEAARRHVAELERELESQEGRLRESAAAAAEAQTNATELAAKLHAEESAHAQAKAAADGAEELRQRIADIEEEITGHIAAAQDAEAKLTRAEEREAALREQLDKALASAADDSHLRMIAELEEQAAVERVRVADLSDALAQLRAAADSTETLDQLARAQRERERDDAIEQVNVLRRQLMAKPGGANGGIDLGKRLKAAARSASGDAQRRVGDILVEAGVISGAQLAEALQSQKLNPQIRLGTILVERGWAEDEVVGQALAAQRGVEFIRIQPDSVDPEAAKAITVRLAEHHMCIPTQMRDGRLIVAMANPLDLIAIEDVERASGMQVDPVVATVADISVSIRKHYY